MRTPNNKMRFQLMHLVPRIEYTETTERIFSTNIETINTVGNVLFIENVAEFYQARKAYKTMVCDSIANRFATSAPYTTLKETLDFEYYLEAIVSADMLQSMQRLFTQCKQMMDVTDEDIEVYRKEREQMENNSSDNGAKRGDAMNETLQLQEKINKATDKLKLE